MRRWMLGSLLAVAAAMLQALATADATVLERIEASGVVRLDFRGNARPYSFEDNAGNATGCIVASAAMSSPASGRPQAQGARPASPPRPSTRRDDMLDALILINSFPER